MTARTSESMGGVFGDPFNEIATITSVSDPKALGRVKVQFADGIVSDWVYVLGSNRGQLSTQYVGATCLIGKAHGNSEDAFVLGLFNRDVETGAIGTPVQLTILNEQDASAAAPSSPGDQGLKCNEGNAGRIYLLDNEMNQDVVVCLRRNNLQEEADAIWAWKSLTHGKWVEKGFDPGVSGQAATTDLSKKVGIPKCDKALEGEIREFSEDRKFRSIMITCRRDENGEFNWGPMSAPPVVFRTTLPECTEQLHGMEAVLDSGDNSQLAICLRYQGEMKWVNPGKREPIQFHRQDPPPTRKEFLESKKPMPALAQSASPSTSDLIGAAGQVALAVAGKSATPFLPSTPLGVAAAAADLLPKAFDGASTLASVANAIISNNSTLPVGSLVSQLTDIVGGAVPISDELAGALKGLGGAADILLRGVENDTVDDALQIIGQQALGQAIDQLDDRAGSVYSAFLAGGALGAIDIATLLDYPELPQEVRDVLAPALAVGADILRSQPKAITDVINSAMGQSDIPLPETVRAITSIAEGDVQGTIQDVSALLSAGGLGEIGQLVGQFSNLPAIPKFSGELSDLPQLASTAMELVGLGKQFTELLGGGGIGLDKLSELTGSNPVAKILGGAGGLGKLLGGGSGSGCPCDPKCRKTEHSEDSDGNVLLEKCGNVVANSHSSYAPEGDPTKNNLNTVAELLGLIPTLIGEDLCIPSKFDLTQLILAVKRVGELADRMESAKNADFPEFFAELIYSMEALEKALKQADNNITGVESIERKLIDAQFRMMRKFMSGSFSYFPQALKDVRENSQAIKDLYNFVRRLDGAKDGPRIGVTVTPKIAAAFKNIKQIPKLSSLSRKEANAIIKGALKPAHKEWKDLEPGHDLIEIANYVLGAFNPSVPPYFDKCKTKRDKNKVLKDSLESKINSPVPPRPQSLLEATLPSSVTQNPTEDIASLLDQISYDQGRARSGQADCD